MIYVFDRDVAEQMAARGWRVLEEHDTADGPVLLMVHVATPQ